MHVVIRTVGASGAATRRAPIEKGAHDIPKFARCGCFGFEPDIPNSRQTLIHRKLRHLIRVFNMLNSN